jgi:hypothetical protein
MATLEAIEHHFWSQVWRCAHHHPCKRCCWPWHRLRTPRYGTVAAALAGRSMAAHRYAYILSRGALILPACQGSFVVTHRCDFPPCCNPVHLVLGTTGDNLRDAAHKGYFCYQRRCQTALLPDGSRVPVSRHRPPIQHAPEWGEYLRECRQRQRGKAPPELTRGC